MRNHEIPRLSYKIQLSISSNSIQQHFLHNIRTINSIQHLLHSKNIHKPHTSTNNNSIQLTLIHHHTSLYSSTSLSYVNITNIVNQKYKAAKKD